MLGIKLVPVSKGARGVFVPVRNNSCEPIYSVWILRIIKRLRGYDQCLIFMSTKNHVAFLVLCLVKVPIIVVCACTHVEIGTVFISYMQTTPSRALNSERQYNETHLAIPITLGITIRDDPKQFAGCWDHLQAGDIVSFVMETADVYSRVMRHGSTPRVSGAVPETWSVRWLWLIKFQKQRWHTLCIFIIKSLRWAATLATYKYRAQVSHDCHNSQHMLKVASASHDERLQTGSKRDLSCLWFARGHLWQMSAI